jgi:hypothetical protein
MFHATVNGSEVSIGSFMYLYQDDPFPGGLTYEIVVADPSLFDHFSDYFQSRGTENLGRSEAGHVFRSINIEVSTKIPDEKLHNPIRFWANTIDRVTFGPNCFSITGICSPHVE